MADAVQVHPDAEDPTYSVEKPLCRGHSMAQNIRFMKYRVEFHLEAAE